MARRSQLPPRLAWRRFFRHRTGPSPRSRLADVHRGEAGEGLRLAFSEFLALPLAMTLGFLVLEGAVFFLDYSRPSAFEPFRSFVQEYLFQDAQTTVQVLQTLAQTVITVASITIPLLLVALQQAAAGLSSQVLDQFLRRPVNRIYAGFFIGLGIFCLLAAATSDPDRNPVYAAAVAVVLSVVAFVLFILLFYTTMHQTRTPIILEAIHDLAADARVRPHVAGQPRGGDVAPAGRARVVVPHPFERRSAHPAPHVGRVRRGGDDVVRPVQVGAPRHSPGRTVARRAVAGAPGVAGVPRGTRVAGVAGAADGRAWRGHLGEHRGVQVGEGCPARHLGRHGGPGRGADDDVGVGHVEAGVGEPREQADLPGVAGCSAAGEDECAHGGHSAPAGAPDRRLGAG